MNDITVRDPSADGRAGLHGSAGEAPLLDIRNLVVEFATDRGTVPVVGPLTLTLPRGRTLGLVGESGSGKTVTALSILRLIPQPPGRISSGQVLYNGTDLRTLSEKRMRDIRGNRIAMIFQEPMTSLNPAFTVGQQIADVVRRHKQVGRQQAWKEAVRLLDLVGIPSAARRAKNYPHAFSGGMRQRVMIAMAVSCQPELLVADEPTTALDVTVQAQILDLLKELQAEFKMTMLLVTHDLGVIADACDEVAVMYAGQLFERAEAAALFENPRNPYTAGLLASMPNVEGQRERMSTIPGIVPPAGEMPVGCRFSPRCPHVKQRCTEVAPELYEIEGGRTSRCIRADELKLAGT